MNKIIKKVRIYLWKILHGIIYTNLHINFKSLDNQTQSSSTYVTFCIKKHGWILKKMWIHMPNFLNSPLAILNNVESVTTSNEIFNEI